MGRLTYEKNENETYDYSRLHWIELLLTYNILVIYNYFAVYRNEMKLWTWAFRQQSLSKEYEIKVMFNES